MFNPHLGGAAAGGFAFNPYGLQPASASYFPIPGESSIIDERLSLLHDHPCTDFFEVRALRCVLKSALRSPAAVPRALYSGVSSMFSHSSNLVSCCVISNQPQINACVTMATSS